MKPGDLVRVRANAAWDYHQLHAFPQGAPGRWVHIFSGDIVMLIHNMTPDGVGGYIDVLHPKHGMCAVLKQILESLDEAR